MENECAGYWSNIFWYPRYVLPTCWTLALLSLLPVLFIFIKSFAKKQTYHQSEKWLFGLSLIFFVIICLFYVVWTAYQLSWCDGYNGVASALSFIGHAVYSLQAILLCMILFVRLILVFKDSVFAVSKYSVFLFIVLSATAIVANTMALIVIFTGDNVHLYAFLTSIAGVIYIFVVIWLNALLAYKLVKLNNNGKGPSRGAADNELVYFAIKISLLCLISTCSIIVLTSCITLINMGMVTSPHFKLVTFSVLQIFDLHTNFFSILFTFSHFDSWYKKMCSCCLKQCHRMCVGLEQQRPAINLEIASKTRSGTVCSQSQTSAVNK